MKRILFVINQFYKGGAESSLLNFIKLLVQCGHEVSLVVYDHQKTNRAISLISELPESVRLCIGCKGSNVLAFRDFIAGIRYDLAVSVGEWHSPEFVMRYANACKKGVWVHADVTSASIPRTPDLFDYDRLTDVWICVSARQCEIMKENAPFLTGQFTTVHNAIDLCAIKAAASAEVNLPAECEGRKVVVMTGNLRPAKNYLRAVEVAAVLKKRGGDAVWLVCGNLADESYVSGAQIYTEARSGKGFSASGRTGESLEIYGSCGCFAINIGYGVLVHGGFGSVGVRNSCRFDTYGWREGADTSGGEWICLWV